ncbi:MAG: 16S rRNA (cytosine(967)-C(5))-methyltransferase RsmB [Clostridiales bacterium]|nr:16S rRNA (cytosine(967)-C(5))-methyltransferase RsmB [Clostridiales bacterium]
MEDRELCYSIIYDCAEKGAFSNLSLNQKGVDDFVRAAVYGTLTYVYAEDHIINKSAGKDVSSLDPKVRTILRFGVWQLFFSDKVPDYAAVNTSVELAKKYAGRASGMVNAVLRKIALIPKEQRDLTNDKSPEAAFSLKPEIYGLIKKSYGKERAPSIARALLKPSPLAIRVNTLKTDKPTLASELELEGFEVSLSSLSEDALIIRPSGDSPSIENSIAYKNGDFMVQGEGAQMASIIASPSEGMRMLDCCAAPGGKSTHLAQLTNNKADITALDINASRVKLIDDNARRLGITSITAKVADSVTYKDVEGFDLILCDAPCSGLGLIGSKPDIRLTITYDRIEQIRQKQRLILDNMAGMVKDGGVLVYSTCTINKAENEDQVTWFTEEHKEFITESQRTFFPDQDGCEGFFVARLRRNNG